MRGSCQTYPIVSVWVLIVLMVSILSCGRQDGSANQPKVVTVSDVDKLGKCELFQICRRSQSFIGGGDRSPFTEFAWDWGRVNCPFSQCLPYRIGVPQGMGNRGWRLDSLTATVSTKHTDGRDLRNSEWKDTIWYPAAADVVFDNATDREVQILFDQGRVLDLPAQSHATVKFANGTKELEIRVAGDKTVLLKRKVRFAAGHYVCNVEAANTYRLASISYHE